LVYQGTLCIDFTFSVPDQIPNLAFQNKQRFN
jgi:hypothetical protein